MTEHVTESLVQVRRERKIGSRSAVKPAARWNWTRFSRSFTPKVRPMLFFWAGPSRRLKARAAPLRSTRTFAPAFS
jgi:hypothetical protein